ncbi:hypothetical protein FHS78_003756 [Parvibaculum indicum]|uniref:hypothetical protein n=1 Tax=Parvibaculum indicum TaxID=562969 RepID=UPI00141E1BBA|nr:hypothetical protein [Parvibaculum indicum]NIJ43441.1 hypothetical protein [Parvibaculum indicum]
MNDADTPAAPADLRGQMITEAIDVTMVSLRNHGNVVGATQERAIAQAVASMIDVALGLRQGPLAIGLSTGFGKTTAMHSIIKILRRHRPDISVAILGQKIEELEVSYQPLIAGAHPISPGDIDVLHTQPGNAVVPTLRQVDPVLGSERPILLATHEQFQRNIDSPGAFSYGGRQRDLIVYDETLRLGRPVSVSPVDLRSTITAVTSAIEQSGSDDHNDLRRQLELLDDWLEACLRWEGTSLTSFSFTVMSAEEVLERVQGLVGRQRLVGFRDFLYNHKGQWRPLNLDDGEDNRALMKVPSYPAELLKRLVNLDASYPIRASLRRMREKGNGRLQPFHYVGPSQDGGSSVGKRYNSTSIHLLSSRGSGRTWAEKLFKDQEVLESLGKEVAQVVGCYEDECGLIWTHKPRAPQNLDVAQSVRDQLQALGVLRAPDVSSETPLVYRTHGQETASNAFSHCTYAIFLGATERTPIDLVVEYLHDCGDPCAEVDLALARSLIVEDVAARFYQGMSRTAMRRCWVDDEGHTQASPTNIYIITRHVSGVVAPPFAF